MSARNLVQVNSYLVSRPVLGARTRLFCFHHAGGSASAYAQLRSALAPLVDVVAIQLPGRESRIADKMPSSMAELVSEIDHEVEPRTDLPFMFYGHSMGALVAHDLAVHREALGESRPERLIVGACRAPSLSPALVSAHTESDEVLTRAMIDIGGISQELLKYPDWVRPVVRLTRQDLHLCASRDCRVPERLPVPIHALVGSADPLVSVDDARGWLDRTTAGGTVQSLDGGHFFFLQESRAAFVAYLSRWAQTPNPSRLAART